ncbi:uncharacterized protein LOC113278226 [Papaver somniferum]|uniref:uncharacterized protein LOC113278226 n=1 Tax=Papaver somniferum TaxID=3469 RepID=UPI000E703816|nr:uncharacterized protein LOC113278226 [Papaver somniferum]
MLYLVNIKELNYYPISILQGNCNLRNLNIEECSKFQGFRAGKDQENENEEVTLLSAQLLSGCSLDELVLADCPVLKFLPDLQGWTSLRKLVIQNCPRVKEYLTYDLKTLSFLRLLDVDFIERDEEPFNIYNSMELAMSQFLRQRRKDKLSS